MWVSGLSIPYSMSSPSGMYGPVLRDGRHSRRAPCRQNAAITGMKLHFPTSPNVHATHVLPLTANHPCTPPPPLCPSNTMSKRH